jgi:septal ring factor EnvC (AmiA/AmiB activator)
VAVLAALLLLALPAGSWADDDVSRLARIRNEIQQREVQAREYREEADGLLQELDGIDRELNELRRSMRVLRRHARVAEKDLEAAKARVTETARLLDESRVQLEGRLVSLYKFSSMGGSRVLYTARDFQSFARGRWGLARILEHDRELFAGYREAEQAWRQNRDASQKLVRELADARRESAAREGQVRQVLVERRNAIALLRSHSRDELRAAHELREAAMRLERAIDQLPRGRGAAAGTGLEIGDLRWPVDGRIRTAFGRQLDPEFGTETLRTGIEIDGGIGDPVRAVGSGKVLFAGWFRGFGQLVILDHGAESVTVSGYLDELETAAGERVAEGQTIGRVGETGSISGPGLYFEIRHMGKPVDPLDWLQPR